MEIYLNTGHTFAVPAAVADHLLRLASHDQLKVLLFVLCHAGETLTHEQIARACSVRAEGVEEALAFWQDANILGSVQKLPGVQLAAGQPAEATEAVKQNQSKQEVELKTASQPKSASDTEDSQPTIRRNPVSSGSMVMNLMPSEIAARTEKDPAMAELFAQTEKSAGRLLSSTELKSFIWMHEYLGLPPDVILMLAVYSIKILSFNPKFMEKIAFEWAENGITTHEAAERAIHTLESKRGYTGQIIRIFKLSMRPTAMQQEIIDQWQKKGYPFFLIEIALEKARDYVGDKITINTFRYMNKILTEWAAAGITTAEAARNDTKAIESVTKKKKSSGKEKKAGTSAKNAGASSFDADDLEKLINQF